MFDRAGIDISGIRRAIGPTATVLDTARCSGIWIVYLKMGYLPDLSDLGAPDIAWLCFHEGFAYENSENQTTHTQTPCPSRSG